MAVEEVECVDGTEQLDLERVAGRRPVADTHDVDTRRRAEHLARAEPASRAHERLPPPSLAVERLEQERLGGSAGPPLEPEARRDHLGLVHDEQIARPQQRREVANRAVLGWRSAPIDEQPSRIALGQGHLCDALGWELVVEVLEAHDPTGYGSCCARMPG
jgi:hypothetical protein